MKTRKHVHEETFPAAPAQLFALLHTPSAIRQWWRAARVVVLPEAGGGGGAAGGGAEGQPADVAGGPRGEFDPPRRMVLTNYRYGAKSGPLPFDLDFVIEFAVAPDSLGSLLRVTQDGFPIGPEADEFYAGCEKGWRDTFAGIRRFLAGGAGGA